jgi:hypothetical protein
LLVRFRLQALGLRRQIATLQVELQLKLAYVRFRTDSCHLAAYSQRRRSLRILEIGINLAYYFFFVQFVDRTAREEATDVGLLTSKRQSVLQPHSSSKDNEQTLWLGFIRQR